jgi:hypothetical protein
LKEIFNSYSKILYNNIGISKTMKKIAAYTVAICTMTLLQCGTLITTAVAQQDIPVLKPPANDIKDIMLTVSPLIDVEYQGESVVVLKADENALLLSNGTLMPFWKAIDVVKNYGYSLNDVTTSGMGSQGNPTRFYAIMSKP